ncbi:MAG TPA: hypothetical protein PKH39_16475 [Woeseiaceae bacterium]|nr:hypothetical protein [Woeseiaceae bacterium]
MLRLLLLLTLGIGLAAWAQDDETDDSATADPVPESIDEMSEEELDDLDLDRNQDHTEEDEDVFKPTDAVSYQQSVPFPVDI